MKKHLAHSLLTVAVGAVLLMPCAHAYLDPGTGSMILQMLAAMFVAVAIFGKSIYHRISGMFSGSSPSRENESEAKDDADEVQ